MAVASEIPLQVAIPEMEPAATPTMMEEILLAIE
jgi:hypothetical protein